jgi:hypothetical protein
MNAIITIPPGTKYLAHDKNRIVKAFGTEPKIGAHGWVVREGFSQEVAKILIDDPQYWLHSKRAVADLQEVKDA